MDDDEYLVDTQTPRESQSQYSQSQQQIPPWGRLVSITPLVKSYDLSGASYTIGRVPSCDICLYDEERDNQWTCLSKKHLTITRDLDSNGPAYITDTSKNGTSINTKKLERKKRYIICDQDEISINLTGTRRERLFKFRIDGVGDRQRDLPPEIAEGYCAMSILGRGACGEVRLVLDRSTSEPYALKSIVKAGSNTITTRINHPDKLRSEIEILQKINYAFTINMVHLMETEDQLHLFLEYMPGGDLSCRIGKRQSLPEDEVKFISYQIALGVRYLHRMGITHRDLKPQNILLSTKESYPHVKITDFGLSKIMEDALTMQTTCGTLLYVAPEVLCTSPSYTKSVDIWSMGVILYYMLTKTHPFENEVQAELCRNIKMCRVNYDDPGLWRCVSISAKEMVKKLLVVNPRRRFSIDQFFFHNWIDRDQITKDRIQNLIAGVDVNSPDNTLERPVKRARLDSVHDESSSTSTSSN